MDFRFGSSKEVIENRKKFFEKNRISLDESVFMNVLHGNKIFLVDKRSSGLGCLDLESALPTDCLVTSSKDIFLCLLVADCLPIVVYDDEKKFISLIHAGWKGLDDQIIGKTVSFLESKFESNPEKFKVFIGPGIRKESYLFNEVKQQKSEDWKRFIDKVENNLFSVDLVGFAKAQLFSSGIDNDRIFDCRIDTGKEKSLYSHYRDKNNLKIEGRFVCVVGMSQE